MNITGSLGAPVSVATQAARTALTLLAPREDVAAKEQTATSQRGAGRQPDNSMQALLRYARVAKSLSLPQKAPTEIMPELTGGGTNAQGYLRSGVMTLDQLEPEYAREWGALGVTHVVRLAPPELSDEEFQLKISATLDTMYADDPAYLTAKADGAVLIQRMSDIEAEVPGFRHSYSAFEFYRGNSHIGGGAMGIPSPAFEKFWAGQNAAGTYVVPGMSMDTSFVARWPMA